MNNVSSSSADDSSLANGRGEDEAVNREKYKKALRFYKDQGVSAHLPYQTKLRLVALTQQALHGEFEEAKVSPLGVFDVIGKDRRFAWRQLGSMPKNEARTRFVEELSKAVPDELKQSLDQAFEQEGSRSSKACESGGDVDDSSHLKKAASSPSGASVEAVVEEDEAGLEERLSDLERQRQEDQRRQIQDALNRQTFSQFRAYAEQQYPDNPDQQAVLIRELQEQHYFQYMQQIYQQQMETHATDTIVSETAKHNQQRKQDEELADSTNALRLEGGDDGGVQGGDEAKRVNDDNGVQVREVEGEEEEEEEDDHSTQDGDFVDDIPSASMWTKKEIVEFKQSIQKEGGDAIIKVGHGETVTVRVPTHDEGTALFWEFATDSYDIAFGLFFEWNKSADETEVSVHISDSEDEDVDDEYGDESGDPESGSTAALVDKGPPTSVVVPIYRRDCHQEVYAGTHQYPGPGVYLLKFDNTYSLWRSKTLYYRVYYTR